LKKQVLCSRTLLTTKQGKQSTIRQDGVSKSGWMPSSSTAEAPTSEADDDASKERDAYRPGTDKGKGKVKSEMAAAATDATGTDKPKTLPATGSSADNGEDGEVVLGEPGRRFIKKRYFRKRKTPLVPTPASTRSRMPTLTRDDKPDTASSAIATVPAPLPAVTAWGANIPSSIRQPGPSKP
jgi:hypothetical protein